MNEQNKTTENPIFWIGIDVSKNILPSGLAPDGAEQRPG